MINSLIKQDIAKVNYLNFDEANLLNKAINHNADALAKVIAVLINIDKRLEALEYLHSPAVALADEPNENAANPDAHKEKPERLTIREWANLDPWETCGNQFYCTRGNCLKTACIVPKLYAKLAAIEDEQEAAESKGASE